MSEPPTTVSLHDRPSLVTRESLGRAIDPLPGFGAFLDALPQIYAGLDLRRLARRWAECAVEGRPVGIGFGAHVIKVGVQAHLIDLLERDALQFLGTHGAGAIHDIELALAGRTSEDVAAALDDRRFGMTGETVEVWENALSRVHGESIGLGEALGLEILDGDFRFKELSLLAKCVEAERPMAVLVAVGTDTIHVHPNIDGAALGEGSLRDFRALCRFVSTLENGLWLNLGSAVIMPEAFLKGVALARNAGADLSGMMTAVLDMIRHYRPTQNVVLRPPGEGLQLIGQHELMIPLLHQAVRWYMDQLVEGDDARA
ncbi:MAG: hypothetical protein ISR76_05890 [Planctomycetes bacterium]|nr:hypothetical protein [bacterium]MBL7008510.1 hypothetical protein [Planctomycetota bacterium]